MRACALRSATQSAGGGLAGSGCDGKVPHPTTLMKLTSRSGEEAVAGLNEALWAKAAAGELLSFGPKLWSAAAQERAMSCNGRSLWPPQTGQPAFLSSAIVCQRAPGPTACRAPHCRHR
jgi:hypothetical protein